MNGECCKVAFLDRDGTINVDHGYVWRWAEWKLTERAVEALAMLQRDAFRIAIVTNQSAIARGYCSRQDVDQLHARVVSELAACGITIDAIAVCPHGPEATCGCRQPAIGMALQIESQLGRSIDFRSSRVIGDNPRDMGFGNALGMRTALIHSPYWDASNLDPTPTMVVESLHDAALRIVANMR